MLYSLLIVVDVLLALAMIGFILIQQGKGATAGVAFGSGASSTVFGSRGSASFMSRATGVLATLFFINSLVLAFIAGNQPAPTSVVDKVGAEVQQERVIEEPKEARTLPETDTPDDLPQ